MAKILFSGASTAKPLLLNIFIYSFTLDDFENCVTNRNNSYIPILNFFSFHRTYHNVRKGKQTFLIYLMRIL